MNEKEINHIMAAVKWYQRQHNFHPLTCETHSDTPLVAGITYPVSAFKDGFVVLYCPKCNYCQEYIPDVVLKSYEEYQKTQLIITNKHELNEIILRHAHDLVQRINNEELDTDAFFKILKNNYCRLRQMVKPKLKRLQT
jgi:hypothetical protein